MSKLSKFFADIASKLEEQAQASVSVLTDETSAEQRKKTVFTANNLVRIEGTNSASTSHAEELKALSALVSDANVAKLFKECSIDASKIAALAKYNKAKVNKTFAKLAQNIVPDWTKNDENAFAFFELMKKHGTDSITLQQIQRFLGHTTLTQASYISNLWRALGVASERGSKNDRTLIVDRSSKLSQRIATMYALTWSDAAQEEREAVQQDQDARKARSEAASVRASNVARAKREEAASNALQNV